jgi:group I intron endonuclease
VIVYLIRNTANGKCYVGKTTRPLWHRWSQHKCEAKLGRLDTPLYRDMRVYQLHCFEVETLAQADSSRRTAQLERKFIRIFNTVESGYNLDEISHGGRLKFRGSTLGRKHSAETIRKMAESNARTYAEKRKVAA